MKAKEQNFLESLASKEEELKGLLEIMEENHEQLEQNKKLLCKI